MGMEGDDKALSVMLNNA